MAKRDVTPAVLVAAIRENQNNNKTLKSLFSNQFLGKFSTEELEALQRSIDREIKKREAEVIQEHIDFLQRKGYRIKKD